MAGEDSDAWLRPTASTQAATPRPCPNYARTETARGPLEGLASRFVERAPACHESADHHLAGLHVGPHVISYIPSWTGHTQQQPTPRESDPQGHSLEAQGVEDTVLVACIDDAIRDRGGAPE